MEWQTMQINCHYLKIDLRKLFNLKDKTNLKTNNELIIKIKALMGENFDDNSPKSEVKNKVIKKESVNTSDEHTQVTKLKSINSNIQNKKKHISSKLVLFQKLRKPHVKTYEDVRFTG